MDLTAIHQLLVMTHYRDNYGTNELLFQEWTQQMRDLLEARKHGDLAFRDKDLKIAIDCYSQVKSTDAGRKSSTAQLSENHEKLKNKVAAPKSDPSSAPPHITY